MNRDTVAEYDHLYRKFLRAGSLDVAATVDLMKKFLAEMNDRPAIYEDIASPQKFDFAYDQLSHVWLPYR